MAEQNVGRTALGAATCRLIEQYRPADTRLFNDPVVKSLVGTPIRVLLQFASMRNLTIKQTDAVAVGIFGAQICRTRYIDDTVQAALAGGIRQLVILGAGFDTRPYRLAGIENVKVFEVDLPSVQEDKKKKLAHFLGQLPPNVTFIPIDFNRQALDSVLAGSAFDSTQPAVFIWEAVTQYITEDAVRQTLSFIGKSAAGSMLVFTYVLKSVIEQRTGNPDLDKMVDFVAKNNAPWVFGLEPATIREFLQPFHLDLVEDVGNADYQQRYLRPIGRDLVVSEAEQIAQAIVK